MCRRARRRAEPRPRGRRRGGCGVCGWDPRRRGLSQGPIPGRSPFGGSPALITMTPMTESKTMLITGASTGIGAETARQAHAAGYRLVLSARGTEKLEELATELGGGDDVLVQSCDVTEWEQVENLVAAGRERFGDLDVVFANAGFGAARGFNRKSTRLNSS